MADDFPALCCGRVASVQDGEYPSHPIARLKRIIFIRLKKAEPIFKPVESSFSLPWNADIHTFDGDVALPGHEAMCGLMPPYQESNPGVRLHRVTPSGRRSALS